MIKNKAKLVAQGYTEEEGIDYDEVFAPVERIEAIRLFLAYASFKDFMVYQMDVKSAFLYGKIEEKVYVCQPPGFEDLDFPNDQDLKMQTFLIEYTRLRKHCMDYIKPLKLVYVDDIIFGLTKKELCNAFEKYMLEKFKVKTAIKLKSPLHKMQECVPAARYQVNPKVSHLYLGKGFLGTDKSKITRKQSKTGKHGHENQKSTKPKPEKSSLRSLKDKILVPKPDSSPRCARCGTPIDGPSCRGCAFLRKKFDEDLLAYCVENGIFKDFQNTFESSNDNTNIVNALREPCIVNQDPGKKSSQEPPQIDHNCCYECSDSSDGIFCRQCICKSYGKGAHYGYNCPPKVPIISNPEQCNQTINELLQILPIIHPTCNYETENSFAYVPNPNSFDNSPKVSYHPPQPQFPFVYEHEPCYNQNFNDNYFP
ncbi:zinc finger, CCHC-type containing protein [Tanacetum coccineum]